jgi:hypothetical protein
MSINKYAGALAVGATVAHGVARGRKRAKLAKTGKPVGKPGRMKRALHTVKDVVSANRAARRAVRKQHIGRRRTLAAAGLLGVAYKSKNNKVRLGASIGALALSGSALAHQNRVARTVYSKTRTLQKANRAKQYGDVAAKGGRATGGAKPRGKGMSRSQAASIAAKARWGRR